MRFRSLTHLLEVVSAVAHPQQITVLGSSALLAIDPSLGETGEPLELSYDADLLVSPISEEIAAVLTEAVGENSLFSRQNGYHADILRPSVAESLPLGWRSRLLQIPGHTRARALNRYDLAIVKLALGRQKDFALLRALLKRGLITPSQLRDHYHSTPLEENQARTVGCNLHTLFES
jgi:hypothetical protein